MSHKNDPDYHDTRAKILLETATHFNSLELGTDVLKLLPGVKFAEKELRRLASDARREHGKVLSRKRRAGRKINPELVEA